MYDYLIVGSGLFGSVFAREAANTGKRVCVIDKRSHIGGNVYTENVRGITVHKYGAHIFHMNDIDVWNYVQRYAEWLPYTHSPIANYHGEIFNLPFNMNTFHQLFGVISPKDVMSTIDSQRVKIELPRNFKEQALNLVGRDVYEKLIKQYTEKQWGCKCSELPASLIKRVPMRFLYDNNYFNDTWQAIPKDGYTSFIESLLDGIEVRLNTEYNHGTINAHTIIYTGAIDEYFDYRLGELEYRSLRFEHNEYDSDNVQGCAVINYTSHDVEFTRTIEHRHFDKYCNSPISVVTREYPQKWHSGLEKYYPVEDERNISLYRKYQELANKKSNVIFGGRLGTYSYLDMDKVISQALTFAREVCNGKEN